MDSKPNSVVSLAGTTTTLVTAVSVTIAAIVHVVTFFPEAMSNIYPRHDVGLLDFYNWERLVLANKGDYDYFLSHMSYNHTAEAASGVLTRAQALLDDDELVTDCLRFEMESGELTPDHAKANCAAAKANAEAVIGKLKIDPSDKAWIPGQKNRGIGENLPRDETRLFSLKEKVWAGCPYIKPDGTQDAEVVRDRALALFAVTYQIFPGECMEASYMYRHSRNYMAAASQYAWFPDVEIASEATVSYRTEDAEKPQRASQMVAHAEEYERMTMPDIVSHLKYRNSQFCADLVEAYVGIKTVRGDPDCVALGKQ